MNKANDGHSKKEKPGKEFLFPMVFSFPVIPSGGPEARSRRDLFLCHAERSRGIWNICPLLVENGMENRSC